MIEDIKEITEELDKIWDFKTKEEANVFVESLFVDKLGIPLDELKAKLSNVCVAKAEEATVEMKNIAPLGDYSKLIEDNIGMANFLKEEAHKPEHWKLSSVFAASLPRTVAVEFKNDAVDDGNTFDGFVYLSFNGKIKHAFIQGA
jgi:hypothetical protein